MVLNIWHLAHLCNYCHWQWTRGVIAYFFPSTAMIVLCDGSKDKNPITKSGIEHFLLSSLASLSLSQWDILMVVYAMCDIYNVARKVTLHGIILIGSSHSIMHLLKLMLTMLQFFTLVRWVGASYEINKRSVMQSIGKFIFFSLLRHV